MQTTITARYQQGMIALTKLREGPAVVGLGPIHLMHGRDTHSAWHGHEHWIELKMVTGSSRTTGAGSIAAAQLDCEQPPAPLCGAARV